MRNVVTGAIAAVAVLAAGAAQADVVYTATLDVNNVVNQPFVYSFDLTNAQVATGAFDLTARGSGLAGSYEAQPASFSGDVNGFNSLAFAFDETATPGGYFDGTLTADLTFDPTTDALETVNVNLAGAETDAIIYGSGSDASLHFASDDPYLCPPGSSGSTMTCTLSLSFATTATPGKSVPEPATFAMLGAGLLGLAGLRRVSAWLPRGAMAN